MLYEKCELIGEGFKLASGFVHTVVISTVTSVSGIFLYLNSSDHSNGHADVKGPSSERWYSLK